MTPLRVGALVPSSNTVVEPQLRRLLGTTAAGTGTATATAPGVELFVTRVRVTHIDTGPDAGAQFDVGPMAAAAQLLADARVDVLVWAGTSGSWLGFDADRHLVDELERRTGLPATTASLALRQAWRAYGVRQGCLITPYVPAVAAAIAARYGAEGLAVTAGHHLGLRDNYAFGEVRPDAIADLVEAQAARPWQAALVVCTNLAALPVVARCETSTGRPVLDSVAACLWGAAVRVGAPLEVPGAGTLLAHGVRRHRLQALCDDLLATTGADRVTVRLTDPGLGVDVALPAAEAVGPGVRSIRWDPSLDQRALETVRWVDEHRRPLVQPDFGRPPFPPDALRDVYGVSAQLLAPIGADVAGPVPGWVSVHSLLPRRWTAAEEETVAAAASRAFALASGSPAGASSGADRR